MGRVLDQQIAADGRSDWAEVQQRPDGAAAEDPSGSRSADGAGYGADAGRGEPVCSARAGGEYLGLVPSEYSSGGKQRLGHISKQGSA